MANFSCVKYGDNKTFPHKAIKGGKMRVGSLVRTTYPNSRVGIVVSIEDDDDLVKCCFGWAYKPHLEVICE